MNIKNKHKLDAKTLRTLDESTTIPELKRYPVFFILDTIYDTYNIGGLFRLADALCISKLYICGDSEIPPNIKIQRASIGTYKIVPWQYCTNASKAITIVKKEYNATVVAIEQHESSIAYYQYCFKTPLALVVGNETSGITKHTLQKCDAIVDIPMMGLNISLNVIVSASIVSYHVYNTLFFNH